MLHLGAMTKQDKPPQQGRSFGDNAPQPARTLRDWLDHLEAPTGSRARARRWLA
jgi:hypothetical protein